ncbi:MAG: hypothetical protein J6A59_05610 [Lachnospiraceae bacterium]|nr:hypothetical protein [Lachnospiraceae bacterium]MBO5407497.1 hypothetical protein [Bacteroidales bacterium]
MKIYRVYEKQDLGTGNYKTVSEKFFSLEKLTAYLTAKKAYFKNLTEPITKESITENITDTYCVDVVIPKNEDAGLWEMMGLPNEDTLLWVEEIQIVQ